ncbi:hypothetical protein FDJ23_gp311 [Erwinia phage vB_EamM_Desertfox]|uniref:Uncharacterized protein n=1 Tax=Erwinia phage vB_EamM_Desertfox TaxID=2060127 RepID=A0A2H5BJD2_9CAUD|nr:hypothetical protein FDJ23_gp311 [Erwinia phage vB_EamM_Desertfox]AUG86418.1 hypothetical protein DESERTFOX_311 [Erwinia phage vB_EamM_Desertfox]
MPKQKLQFENLVASVNDFAGQLGQVAVLIEGFDGGAKRPYLAFALHMLLSSDASERLGAGWYLLLIRAMYNELGHEFTTVDELDDFIDTFYDLFDAHNIELNDAVVNELNIAFDMFEESLDLGGATDEYDD